jgi:CBS domain containing-hemolysin-like protein
MTLFLTLLLGLITGKLILVAGMRVQPGIISRFELDRRLAAGDGHAKLQLRKLSLLPDVITLLQLSGLLLVIAMYALSVVAFGWAVGTIVALLVIALHGALGRIPPIKRVANRLLSIYEPHLLRFAERFPGVMAVLRGVPSRLLPELHVGSREELVHIIDRSGAHLTPTEQRLLRHALHFESLRVDDIMTRRGEIDTIDRKELLGPLVLDDLHKTGHSFFPVTNGGIDQVVGVLHIGDFLSLDNKRSLTAERAMSPHVERLRDDELVLSALRHLLRTHQHLLVVENDQHETVGVLTLHDIITALFGRSHSRE